MNLDLAGVKTYGHLHKRRLYDAFYRREAILFQMVVILATASMRHENQDSVLKQVRKLSELLYPEDPEKRQAQEEAMKDVLRREGQKSYKVVKVKLGERGE